MTATKPTTSGRFISLRIRVTLGATALLTVLLAGLGYWFIDFAVGQAYSRIQLGLGDTLRGAAGGPSPITLKDANGQDMVVAGVFGDRLEELAEAVPPFQEGVDYRSQAYQDQIAAIIKDDPRYQPLYQQQLDWLKTLRNIEPRGYAYTFVKGKGPQEHQVIFIADVWSLDPDEADRARATQFGEYYIAEYRPEVLDEAFKDAILFKVVDTSELAANTFPTEGDFGQNVAGYVRNYDFAHVGDLLRYQDDWGTWVSGYAPVRNSKGEVVGAIGVDFEAAYVLQVRDNIVNTMGLAFVLIYLAVIALVVIIVRAFTGPILSLTKTAEFIGEGNYEQDLTPLAVRQFPDEISTLARVFDIMIDKVAQRERNLRQQVEELKIMVDQSKRDAQVSEIVDSDFFQDLTEKARKLRERSSGATARAEPVKAEGEAKGKKKKS